ncbi:hypothetical protein SAY87_030671 [Trapa incisa]|uniref:NAC domain-containing protein n=2 Tax=Trapa TaxID=22665 RepID=A0AAN7R4I8_TRANT|nr:hypothetical protein SAY87_030671 [Trapa incisa]KAK4787925.1 hypothetical protein SAY86_011758 [Trapa natans]
MAIAMEEAVVVNKEENLPDLPPGFRFHPTDEEIITHYLAPKVADGRFTAIAIGEADLNKCEPWDLPKRAKMEEEWYFFCQKDRKYPTGMRTNRATESGYWKATGKDKEIYRGKGQEQGQGSLLGMKKTLVFYLGRAPKGEKTNWVMHEFRLEGKLYYNHRASKEDWVVCRVFHKGTWTKKAPIIPGARSNSYIEDDLQDYGSLSPPPIIDPADSNMPTSSGFFDAATEVHESKFKPGADSNIAVNMAPSTSLSTSLPKSSANGYYPSRSSSELQSSYYSQMMNIMLSNPILSYRDPVASLSSSSMNPSFSNQLPEGISSYLQNRKMDQKFSSNHESIPTLSQETDPSTDINTTTQTSSSKQVEGLGALPGDDGSNNLDDIAEIERLWSF